jgi:hypothetical protein
VWNLGGHKPLALDALGAAPAHEVSRHHPGLPAAGRAQRDAENVENLRPGYYQQLCKGKDEDWIGVYVDGQDAVAVPGSVYGTKIAEVRARGGVADFEHGNDHVFTAWDFGIADSMAIWCFRFNGDRGVDVLDWYENSGEGLPHYFAWLRKRPYQYDAHYLPHDGRNRSWLTGANAIQLFEQEFGPGSAIIAPQLAVAEGIGAARWLLEQPTTRFHVRCDVVAPEREQSALGTLAEYRYTWDEKNKVYSRTPLHNFASHSADGFRVLACAVEHGEIISRPVVPTPPVDQPMVLVDENGVARINRTFNDLAKSAMQRKPTRSRV